MSLDSMLSLAGLLFAVLGTLAALVSHAFGLEWADVLVPFCFVFRQINLRVVTS